MKLKLFIQITLCLVATVNSVLAQSNQNVTNLVSASNWGSLFPKRAGTQAGHPQGYTTDFYSYDNFKQAVDEMADYLVEIRKKDGVWGELITITKKSTSTTYIYSDVESWWYSNPTPETVINVDFENFVNTTSDHNNKRELAAFLANISKETTGGWQTIGSGQPGDYADWGLYFVHEVGLTSGSCNPNVYNDTTNSDYPATAGQCYFGRGPIQLSWNYNYGQFSKFLFNDKTILLDNPDLVQEDGVLAFKSAIWFWMMPQCPKPSCHQVMQELWQAETGDYAMNKMYKKGFAHTNNIINGGLECRNTSSSAFTQKVVLRSELYKYYLSILGFNQTQINNEDSGDYSTLCYESSTNTMQDYVNCSSTILQTNFFNLNKLKVYPNPVEDVLTVKNITVLDKIEVYDILGKKYFEIFPKNNLVEIDFSNFEKGTYFVKLSFGKTTITNKIVKL